jgi:hypothetical protein
MSLVTVTIFFDRAARALHQQTGSLSELAAMFRATSKPTKEELPWLKLATFGAVASSKGCLRNDANVLKVTGVEGDYDGGRVSFDAAIEIAEKAGLECIVATSPSHSLAKPRWRVWAPFSEPLAPPERQHMMARLAGLYGGIFAAESWTLSQSYYFGSVIGNMEHRVRLIEGQPIDVLDDLDAIAVDKPNTTGGNGAERPRLDEDAELQAILCGKSFHVSCVRLLGRWAQAGVPMLEAQQRLVDAFEAVFPLDRDARWRERYADIPRCVLGIYLKEAGKLDDRIELTIGDGRAGAEEPPQGVDDILAALSLTGWLSREIPLPDRLLGHLLTSVTRLMLVAPTGLGKTNFALAIAFAAAHGRGFLGWIGCGVARRVLYVDGEMPEGLMRERLEDAARRAGGVPDKLFVLSRENFPGFEPLNTPAGQRFINDVIEIIGGVDLIVFDNVQALLAGEMKDEEPWRTTLPWVRDLTRRKIGQIWVHHTGHDESHSYGTKTREWQLDVVMLLEGVERPDADIAFATRFVKARARTPGNRADFDPALILLKDDAWTSERVGGRRPRRQAKDRALELLRNAIAREGVIPAASSHIPANTPCVTVGLWRQYCELGCISEGDEKANRRAFERAAKNLLETAQIGKWELLVWMVK